MEAKCGEDSWQPCSFESMTTISNVHSYSIHIPFIFHSYSIHIPFIFHSYSIHIPFIFHSYSIHIPFIFHSTVHSTDFCRFFRFLEEEWPFGGVSASMASWASEAGRQVHPRALGYVRGVDEPLFLDKNPWRSMVLKRCARWWMDDIYSWGPKSDLGWFRTNYG